MKVTEKKLKANRENAIKGGRPKGRKDDKTLEREKVLEEIRQQIMQRAAPLVRAAFIPAMGVNFVYRIDEIKNEKGRVVHKEHVLVEDPHEIAMALDKIEEGSFDPEEKFYYVSAKAPDFRAVEMLINRVFGKAKDMLEVTNPDGNLKTIIINKSVKK
jgi:hypothetical protein